MAFVKKGHIESIDLEAKVERDAKSANKSAQSTGKKKSKKNNETFPIHHYTRDLITEGDYDDSFEEWIFDPIISSKSEYKESMMNSKKEKQQKEIKKKLFEEKVKSVKPSDTFYMLNKKRLNLEPETEKPKSRIQEKLEHSKKKPQEAKQIVLKDMSTFTDFTDIKAEPLAQDPAQNTSQLIPPGALSSNNSKLNKPVARENSPGINSGFIQQNDYLASMEDFDSRSSSANPKYKKKGMLNLQISDINEIYYEQNRLTNDGSSVKKSVNLTEKYQSASDLKVSELTVMTPANLPMRSPRAFPEPKIEVVPEPLKKEETPKSPVLDTKPSNPTTPPSIGPKVEPKPQTSIQEETASQSYKPKEEPKTEPKPAPVTPKVEDVKPKDDKENTKPAETKPASSMARIPLPPTKKPADQKPAETKNETKPEPKPVSKPTELSKEGKKDEPAQNASDTTPAKPAEGELPLPKLSQNPFLAKQAVAKTGQLPPKGQTQSQLLLRDSTLSPVKSNDSLSNSMLPKSPRSNVVDDKINGLRSLWK